MLSSLLPKLISLEQCAFVKGRAINENIAMAQEAIRELDKKSHGGNIILKLDLEKAYDRISWSFLKQVFGRHSPRRSIIPSFVHLSGKSILQIFQATTLACRSSLITIKKFLDSFQDMSGQKINYSKSSFLYSDKLPVVRFMSIERVLGIAKARAGVQYLGVPLLKWRTKQADFQFLIDKVERRISG
ncbi:uncharacterized protein LOC131230513 [Magnolia sinica]|uniref:uncharacterized protein LOC131230513 n=1 Tax=Magnolia sinica TaxID=86752 RepID=UPI00265AF890|nr:uncharacterized protein LOC131230513 [Magnolia sinica]